MRDVVADRANERVPVGGKLKPAVVVDRFDDIGALALVRLDQSLALQDFNRLAHSDPGDFVFVFKGLESRDFVADGPMSFADALTQRRGHLKIAWHAALCICLFSA